MESENSKQSHKRKMKWFRFYTKLALWCLFALEIFIVFMWLLFGRWEWEKLWLMAIAMFHFWSYSTFMTVAIFIVIKNFIKK